MAEKAGSGSEEGWHRANRSGWYTAGGEQWLGVMGGGEGRCMEEAEF